ncbi:hypothetical protein MMC26_000752, partial [Xylographa opegraphella]|nr:hypothetical protein [Xylographa opegraphella]
MSALALNPLSIRNAQPAEFYVRRKYSVRQRNTLNLGLKPVRINPGAEGSTRSDNDTSTYRDGILQERRDIGFDAVSGSNWIKQCQRNTKGTTGAEHRSSYVPILQDKLIVARRAQAEWHENITHDAEQRGAAYRQLLHLAKEERETIANEERKALERDYQQQIDAQLARIASVNLQRQLEAEELRREAERRRLETEREVRQRIKDEEDAIALQQAVLIAEDLQRQEEAEEAERQRVARQRECTVCLDTFDME